VASSQINEEVIKMKPPVEIKDIKDFSFLTSRKLKNEKGEENGAVFLWRRKGEEEFNYKLKCPYCEEEQESSIVFNRRPYRLRCNNCEKSILVEKLSSK
jgi:ribosomal protein S27E